MGNVFCRNRGADEGTRMSSRERKMVRDSWRTFCKKNPDYGVLMFLGMFTKHPEYLQLFQHFKDKDIRTLPNDPKFRAHAYAVGHQLSAIVECLEEPDVVTELIRKNATSHLKRAGVKPAHFQSLFWAALEEMTASHSSMMTPSVVAAWEKLFDVSETFLDLHS
ncbi:hypothetical protein HPB48_012642 [Haemaphysalis longicornis]|uniref:Globin domain-containing protein n=1 Tax=Haemaphysalis longicornis TaxID=44386 RepID=A0A9J6G262_HAELO|nr:hypothetical protein HPB48_012642 [Haemaphysalis longicornis]